MAAETWRCGDCGREVPKSEAFCGRTLDDYLSLRGGSIDTAISRAVEKAIAPLIEAAERRLSGGVVWRTANSVRFRWSA